MNYADIRELSLHQGSPAVSLFVLCSDQMGCLPKINNLLDRAIRDVEQQFPDEDGDMLCRKLHALHSRIFVEDDLRSAVLFVNKHIAWVYQLSYPLTDAIWVLSHFVTWPISYYLERTIRYWVVVIFRGTPHLFEGYDDCVTEIMHRHNLYNGEERIMLQDLAGKVCGPHTATWGKKCRYPSTAAFMQQIDLGLQHFMEADPLPIICFGDVQSLTDFRTYSLYHNQVIASIQCDILLDQESLYQKAWPHVQSWHVTRQAEIMHAMRDAAKAHMCIAGDIEKIWHALHAGSVQLLCIEKGLEHPACRWDTSNSITDAELCGEVEQIDAIDTLVDVAVQRNVPVYWYADGELATYERIVAVVK